MKIVELLVRDTGQQRDWVVLLDEDDDKRTLTKCLSVRSQVRSCSETHEYAKSICKI